MNRLLQSELFRLRKRMQSWLLIAIAFALVGLFYGGFTIGALVASGSDKADFRDPLPFDQLTDFGLSIGLGFFGSVMLIIIAAGMMGNEFSWNTLRPLVARAPSRHALISAKLVALVVYTVVFSLVLSLLIAGLSIVSSVIAGADVAFSSDAAIDAFWFVIRMTIGNLPYLAFAFLLATVARSNAAGIAGALGLSFIEPNAFGLLSLLNDVFESIQKWSINWNIQQLVTWSDSSQQWISLGVVAFYTVLFAGLSYFFFLRRDVTSG